MLQTNVMLPVLPIYADPAHHAGGGSLLFRVRGEGRSPKGRSGRGVLGRSPGRKKVSRILVAQMASLGTCCGIKGGGMAPLNPPMVLPPIGNWQTEIFKMSLHEIFQYLDNHPRYKCS